MEKLKAVRAGNRSAVTRLLRKFDEAKEIPTFDREDLLVAYKNLTEKKKLLEKLNEKILEETEPENVETEILDADEYSKNIEPKLRHIQNFF